MAVLAVTERPQTQADIASNSYTRVFMVQLDNNTDYQGAREAALAVGIAKDDPHPQDTTSLCDSVNAVNVDIENSWYQVTVTYNKPSVTQTGSGSEDPATRATTWSYRAVPISTPATVNYIIDNNGTDIENTAGDLFDTATSVNKYQFLAIATDYASIFSDSDNVRDLIGTLNDDNVTLGDISITAGQGLFVGFNAQEVDDPTYGTYYVKTYEFAIDTKEDWIIKIRNRGLRERFAIGSDRVARIKEIKLNNKFSGARTSVYQDLDVNGLAFRDINGRLVKGNPAHYVNVQAYQKADWTPLTPV